MVTPLLYHDEFLGTLFNAHLAAGGVLHAVRGGQTYLDVGTYDGFRAASALLGDVEMQAS